MTLTLLLFKILVVAHITTGGFGAIVLWIPVLGRKGNAHTKNGYLAA